MKERELFVSDAVDNYSVSALRYMLPFICIFIENRSFVGNLFKIV